MFQFGTYAFMGVDACIGLNACPGFLYRGMGRRFFQASPDPAEEPTQEVLNVR